MKIDPKLLAKLTPEERIEVDALLRADPLPWRPLPGPQSAAYASEADVIGYGGAGGGGKSDLLIGLSVCEHKRVLVVRREKTQTQGIVQRMTKLLGTVDGYSAQNSRWQVLVGSQPLLEFAGLDHPGAETQWQGRPHDLIALDEATELREDQARYLMAWNRTTEPGQRCRTVLTFNPPRGPAGRWVIKFFAPWLDKGHPNPAKPGELRWFTTDPKGNDIEVADGRPLVFGDDGQPVYDFDPVDYSPEKIVTPKSRTFYFAKVTDNPYLLATDYVSQLQSLPEPLRSQLLNGDFDADADDDVYQVCPTAWVEAAMARWKRPDEMPPMDSLGVDVARGGRDQTILARRHGMWFDVPLVHPGATTPDGGAVAALAIAAQRDRAPIHVDVIGVGSSPYDVLRSMDRHVIGVNVSLSPSATDKTGRLMFKNLRAQLWWRMREALDPSNATGIALPPDSRLLADLCAPKWRPSGRTIAVQSTDEIKELLGRSPDFGSAYCLALIHTSKRSDRSEWEREVERVRREHGYGGPSRSTHHPFDGERRDRYDPFSPEAMKRRAAGRG